VIDVGKKINDIVNSCRISFKMNDTFFEESS
jgi:hypothetical protein